MAYFGKLIVDNEEYLVGSTLYGVCNTSAGTSAKVINTGLLGTTFDELIEGITVNIKFTNGCTVDTISLRIGSVGAQPVHGNCKCNTNAVLSFTYGSVDGVYKWILNAGEKTATTVMQTYDSTSTEPISGRGVAEAIAPLVPGGNSAANYSVETEIGENPSNAKVPTSQAVANYVNNAFAENDALVYKGTINSNSQLPINGYSAGWIYKIANAGTYLNQKCEVNDLIMAVNDGSDNAFSIISSDWVIIQTNIENPVSGPNSATQGHVATFGATSQQIVDSGYTIETSVPQNAVFTDTQYEEKGTIQAIIDIGVGNDFILASTSSGRLHITGGLSITKSAASTGIQEVV